MPSTDADTLVVYSDYVCPFCHLGKASLEQALERVEDPPEVEFRPFDLRRHKRREDGSIDRSVEDGKDEAYFEQVRRNVQRLADEFGVEMTLDVARDVDALAAHRVALAVEDAGDEQALEAYHDAVFEALWSQGRDVGDPAVLRDIVEAVGLDGDLVEAALADETLGEELDERLEQAHRSGVTGVPTFVHRDYAIPGALPPDKLVAMLEQD